MPDPKECWVVRRLCEPVCMAYGGIKDNQHFCLVLQLLGNIANHLKISETRQRTAVADLKRAASIPANPLPPIGKPRT